MALKISELISILCCALVGGMYWGPWLALTRTLAAFEPGVFLAIVRGLTRNMAPVMTVLSPLGLLSIVPVLFLSYGLHPHTFYFNLAGLILFAAALVVTLVVEMPIVKQIVTWTEAALPENWQALRDRLGAFHIIRVAAGIAGLALVVAGAIFD